MLNVRWQQRPLDSGSHLTGGRWSRPDVRALYLSADYATTIEEMHQLLIRPGTLVAFDVDAARIADLTGADPALTRCAWRRIHLGEQGTPPTWPLIDALIGTGADGALISPVQRDGGVNLVLWHWHAAVKAGRVRR
ncbi:RES domain-containing protein [Sphingomonas sp.]|uniref:RES domain-containing protein n=1 Tax=Sphingomonas sp. TaxID=28214 RepID=UPI0035C87DF6